MCIIDMLNKEIVHFSPYSRLTIYFIEMLNKEIDRLLSL